MMKNVFPYNWSLIFSIRGTLKKNFAISFAPSAAQRLKRFSRRGSGFISRKGEKWQRGYVSYVPSVVFKIARGNEGEKLLVIELFSN
jgi:hypothetical protein